MSIAEDIAMWFHATYERLAPELGYTTREASAVPWPDVPEKNRRLMIATVQRLLDRGVIVHPAQPMPTVATDMRRWKEAEEEWSNGVLLDCPDSWDGDDAAEHIALSYVATLEARCDAAGVSREKWMGEE
jgi:hypothetical protein